MWWQNNNKNDTPSIIFQKIYRTRSFIILILKEYNGHGEWGMYNISEQFDGVFVRSLWLLLKEFDPKNELISFSFVSHILLLLHKNSKIL